MQTHLSLEEYICKVRINKEIKRSMFPYFHAYACFSIPSVFIIIYNCIPMSFPFRLKLNDKLDQKLLQNFPKDPYSDLLILTQTLQLELSSAYLAIQSRFFAALPPACQQVDLSHLDQHWTVLVLRALYGGELEAGSAGDLEQAFKVIDFLGVDQFRQNMETGLRSLHEQKKDASPLNHIEMVQFCMKTGVLKQQALSHHFSARLKVLQSSKNYLQLGKLSDNTLNSILLQFCQREGQAGQSVINHILENYFNRKSYRPVDYFQDSTLAPLRAIWEKFHHKVNVRRLEKTTSIQQLKQTAPLTLARTETSTGGSKFGRLANLPAISTHSVNLTAELLKSQGGEEGLLDLRIQALTRELQQKNRKLQVLQGQMKELMQVKAKREQGKRQMQASIDDESLLKNVLRSRKSREEQLKKGDHSVSTNEVAYENVKRAVQEEREGKMKLVSKNSNGTTGSSKKMFN